MRPLLRRGWRIAWLAFLALILWLTLGPGKMQPEVVSGDKIAHFGVFLLLILAAPWTMDRKGKLAALALAALLGGGIELLQGLFPSWHRTCDLFDFLADLAGGGCGLGLRLAGLRSSLA